MTIIRVNDRLSIGDQPSVEIISSLAGQGIGAMINLRPDGEEQGQPGNRAERDAAEASGMAYTFIPVSTDTIREADVLAFQRAVNAGSGQVFAHCQSGKRALMLHALGEALEGRLKPSELGSFGQEFGFDLSAGEAWLARHLANRPEVKAFFDARTSSVQYVVSDPATAKCAIIDPVLDFDEKSGSTATRNADAILAYIAEKGLAVEWILDTHPHADHFSAAHYLKQRTGAPTAIGEQVVSVQKLWKAIYNWPSLETDGSQWDKLFADGETFRLGSIEGRILFSPGHTLASIAYVIGNAAFIHDTLFQPDSGSARADFPGGDARRLWASIERILSLPEDTRLFTGHDYQPGGRTPKWESSIAEQKRQNAHLAGIDEEAFVRLRVARDKTLPMPKLILQSLQVNIRGGRLPEPEENGRRYLKIPLDGLENAVW